MDLAELKRSDPQKYKMLNAEEVVRVDGELVGPVAQTLAIVFPEADIFRIDLGSTARYRVFPEPSERELERIEDAAARLVTATSVPHAMFRVVNDLRGERREVLVPVLPAGWRGDARVVGPFESERAAQKWSDRHVQGPLVADAFSQGGSWFVDVFAGDEEMIRAGR